MNEGYRGRRVGVLDPGWAVREGLSKAAFELRAHKSLGKNNPSRGNCKHSAPGPRTAEHDKLEDGGGGAG